MTDADEDDLILEIMRRLEIDWQYVAHLDATDAATIARLRSAGRKAGRRLGVKVRTFQSDPGKRDDAKVVVIITVNQAMDPEDEARMEARSRLLLEEYCNSLGQN